MLFYGDNFTSYILHPRLKNQYRSIIIGRNFLPSPESSIVSLDLAYDEDSFLACKNMREAVVHILQYVELAHVKVTFECEKYFLIADLVRVYEVMNGIA